LYLVDTSVWIDYMREEENDTTARFVEVSDRGYPFGITGVIYQEILQGAASQAKFDYLAEYLGTQRFYHLGDPIGSYREAAQLYFLCRRAGTTIRSATDCLIAQVAIEHDLFLLHSDQDFDRMAEVIPALQLA
jgi:predicted nucleic acid-binding protein